MLLVEQINRGGDRIISSITKYQNGQRKEKGLNKKKVLAFLDTRGRITNDEVEGLLGVSNATAERYLDELENSGEVKQIGKTGRGVFYTR